MKGREARRLAWGGLLAALLLYFFFRGVEWSELASAFRSARPPWLGAVVLATFATYALRAWRWGYLLAPLAEVPLWRLISATFVGFMSGLFVPRAGEVVRPYLVGRRHGVKTSAAFASIILERLVDLMTMLFLFGLYLYVLPMPEQQTRGPLLGVLKAAGGLAGLGTLAILAVLVVFHLNAERAMTAIDRALRLLPARLARLLSEMLRAFGGGLAVLKAPARHLLAVLAQSLLVWLSICLSVYSNNRAFGVELPFHSTFLIISFLTVGVAIPTPGNVGGFHETYLLALTEAFGVGKETAAAAGISAHALTNLPVLVVGLLLLPGEGLTFGKVADMAEDGGAGNGRDERDKDEGQDEDRGGQP